MKNTSGFPWWVSFGLWGIAKRKNAMAFTWFCVALGVLSAAYGFVDPSYFAGIGFFLAAWWYWVAIQWVDKNAKWE